MVHENKIYLSVSYIACMHVFTNGSQHQNRFCPSRALDSYKETASVVSKDDSHKYSHRSFGLLSGKVTHTFLLINRPRSCPWVVMRGEMCLLSTPRAGQNVTYSVILSFQVYNPSPSLEVLAGFYYRRLPGRIRTASVTWACQVNLLFPNAGLKAEEAGSMQVLSSSTMSPVEMVSPPFQAHRWRVGQKNTAVRMQLTFETFQTRFHFVWHISRFSLQIPQVEGPSQFVHHNQVSGSKQCIQKVL